MAASLYFAADDGDAGTELWAVRSNGTVELVADIVTGGGDSEPAQFTAFGNAIYFTTVSPLDSSLILRRLNADETVDSIGTVSPVEEFAEDAFPGVVFDDKLYFFGQEDGEGDTAFYSVNASGVVSLAADIANPSFGETGFAEIGGKLIFNAFTPEPSTEIWTIDAAGQIELFGDLTQLEGGLGFDGTNIRETVLFQDKLYLSMNVGNDFGVELYTFDGVADPVLVSDIRPGDDGSGPRNLMVAGDTLFFTADDGVTGTELWRMSAAGAVSRVTDINPGPGTSFVTDMTVAGSKLFFVAENADGDEALYRATGNGAAVEITDVSPTGSHYDGPDSLGVFGDEVYFVAESFAQAGTRLGDRLWRINPDESVELVESAEDINPMDARDYAVFEGELYFSADGSGSGRELWKVGEDGLASLVAEIREGSPGSFPENFFAFEFADTGGATLGDDNLAGTAGDDEIDLLAGDDTYDGLGGNDDIFGNAGFDSLFGGDGNDTLDGGSNPGDQGDILIGGRGNDVYRVDHGFDLVDEGIVFGGAADGVDEIISTADFYWDFYSAGEVLRLAEDAVDPEGDGTTLVGSVFSNFVVGNSQTNVLFGRGGADTYIAGDGIDFISLSLLGLTEENAYVGVDGPNTIIVEQRESGQTSYDIVFEFESGKDKVDLSDYGFASAAAAFATGVDDGAGNSYFILGDGFDYLYMVGLTLGEMSAGDFIV